MIKRFKLTITVKGPILTRSNGVGVFGIDAPVARTPDGIPCMPGTLVLGRLAEALRQLGSAQEAAGSKTSCLRDLDDFFAGGDPATAGDEAEGRGRRRRIFVSDLVAQSRGRPEAVDAVRTRIAIDNATGSALRGAIQVIEAPYATGERVDFVGELRILGTEKRVDDFTERLEKALAWISQWGGLRGLGYGEAIRAKLDRADRGTDAEAAVQTNTSLERQFLLLTLHDPFCVGERRIASNIYESSDTIAGGVIKGAIAAQILAGLDQPATALRDVRTAADPNLQALAEQFDSITIRHATPVMRSERPAKRGKPLPLSLAAIEKTGELIDAAALADPVNSFVVDGKAPRFMPDWKRKNFDTARRAFQQASVSSDLRVRTKIDADRRAADTGKLFAIRYRRVDEHVWLAEIDLSGVDAGRRGAAWAALQKTLAGGLAGIGRGGAFASASLYPVEAAPPRAEDLVSGRLALMLRSPALLRRPDPARRDDVTGDYRDAFAAISGVDVAGMRLEAIFVDERLSGAEFMARRLPPGIPYRPFLLTEAGSVFVFEVDASARNTINGWLRHGLTIPAPTLEFYGLDRCRPSDLWQYCPYLRENGFGEVSLVDACATDGTELTVDPKRVTYVEGPLAPASGSAR